MKIGPKYIVMNFGIGGSWEIITWTMNKKEAEKAFNSYKNDHPEVQLVELKCLHCQRN